MSCGYTGGCGYKPNRGCGYTGGCGHTIIGIPVRHPATANRTENKYVLTAINYNNNTVKVRDIKTNQIFSYNLQELLYILSVKRISIAGIIFNSKTGKIDVSKEDARKFLHEHNIKYVRLNY